MSKQEPKQKTKYDETLERLHAAVEGAGGTNAAAFQLGRSPATLSLILNEKRDLTDVDLAYRIQVLWGIEMEGWARTTEPQKIQRFAR